MINLGAKYGLVGWNGLGKMRKGQCLSDYLAAKGKFSPLHVYLTGKQSS